MPLHLIKLAVGISSIQDLRDRQAERARALPPLRHRTRSFPKRAQEIVGGGSIYWVISRMITVRQPIRDIVVGAYDDGSRCTDLMLAPELVPVRPRPMKPFQGWRYLAPADAPVDDARNGDALPDKLRRELAILALL